MGSRAGAARRLRMSLAAVAASVALLTGCANLPIDLLLPPGSTQPARDGGTPDPVSLAPLRGTPADAVSLRHPSLAVKIDNHEAARPQLALNRSDLVFEELVEGGLTRYLVVWHSEVPAEVGPVRSIRPMDPAIASPFGGIIAYSGGQAPFVDLMKATSLVNLVFDDDDTGLFERAEDRSSPHDVILDAAGAVGRYGALSPPPAQFSYAGSDPLAAAEFAASATSRVELAFSEREARSWEWDAVGSAWLRSQDGEPDHDASGERVRATNIVTLRVAIDGRYGEVPLTVMTGTGEAWVSVAGRTAHGTWSKDADDSPVVLTSDDGRALPLAPGNTWIELVPLEGAVAFGP